MTDVNHSATPKVQPSVPWAGRWRWTVGLALMLALIIPAMTAGLTSAQPRQPRPTPQARPHVVGQTYSVTIDTTKISGKSGKLVFDLTANGSATNVVNITNFSTDGSLGLPETQGGFIEGDIILGSNPAALTTISESYFGTPYFFTELAMNFNAFGNGVTFQFEPSQTFSAGQVPDQLSLFMLDSTDQPLFPTADPLAANALLTVDINGAPGGHVAAFAPTVLTSPSSFQITVPPLAPVGGPLVTLLATPVRLVDTRQQGTPIIAGNDQCFALVGGAGGIPSDAVGIVVNATAVGQSTNGWLTLYPAGQSLPATSTLNFGVSQYAIANGTIMRLGAGGQVCVDVGTVNSAPGSSHAILDATGYLPASALSGMTLLPSPVRLADTRTTTGAVSTGATQCFPVAGLAGIPNTAAAVLLNVTAVGYTTNGWLTAFPSGQSVPATSTVNFDGSEYAIANNAIVRIGGDGQVCVNVGTIGSNPGSSQIVLDVVGYLAANGLTQMPMLSAPQRIVDTRSNGGPINGGTSRCFAMAGVSGIPASAIGVIVNLTAVGYTTQGWETAYPAGAGVPATSTLNFDTIEYAMANGAIIGLAGGQLCVNVGTTNSTPGSSHVILDVVGYLLPATVPMTIRRAADATDSPN